MAAPTTLLRQDVAAAIKRSVRQYGKTYSPPETLKALDNLQIKQSTIADAMQAEPGINVKSYQISEWLRGTAPCPVKYHDGLSQVLGTAIKAANSALRDAESSGLYPRAALERYRARVRDAEQLLQAAQTQQGRLLLV